MLTELRITNFAVIEQASLQLTSGFQVLTGETGAGKSILVDAVALLMGGRASGDHIRAGADEAVLEAAWTFPVLGPATDRIRQAGLLGAQETEVIIRRVLSRSGRHRAYVNGNLAPLTLIQSLAGLLIDIHGQHEQQSLLSLQVQLDALDAFGRLGDLRKAYAFQFGQWRERQRALEEARRVAAQRRDREDLLRFQVRELDEAAVQPGEEETLGNERRRLAHAQRLRELAETAYAVLYEGDGAILTSLGAVMQQLRELGDIDAEAAEWLSLADGAAVQLREVAHRLGTYRGAFEQDPERLMQIEERLDRLHRLKHKYGGDADALVARCRELTRQLEELESSEARAAELEEEVAGAQRSTESLAMQLSERRTRAAAKMEKRIKEELAALRMEQTRFEIQLGQSAGADGLGPAGRDRVEFLLSANPGEPLLPLARVASGGELSRIMLAIKSVLAETDGVPVLIFDEVDTGIGGAVATVMGQRLRSLGQYHQVLCLTHLPQIASQADAHFLVEKSVVKKRTVTRVRRLDETGRREEIARMLAGLAVTKAARQTAAEMIGEHST
jgi:DNA repair protein RecN (Recombination protein N)